MSRMSFSAVQRFKRESPYLRSHRRGTRKSGSMDENSLWCRASLARVQCNASRALRFNDNRRPTASDLEQEGGVWDEEHPTMTAKFPGECRLLCGVAAVDRVVRGNRMIGTVVEDVCT